MQNQNLHKEFIKLAFDINKMKNKLMSLLLEIHKKEIYKNYNCVNIYEYGFKYAKLSKEVVQKALRTLKNIGDKPFLQNAIKTQGIHKVALVATLATKETDKMFAEHVRNMSKPALTELAKELREKEKHIEEENLFNFTEGNFEKSGSSEEINKSHFSTRLENSQVCRAENKKIKIEFDEEMEILFLRLKKKYAKDDSDKHALKKILRKLVEEEKNSKIKKHVPGDENFSSKSPNCKLSNSNLRTPEHTTPPQTPSRYIKIQQKRNLIKKYNKTCAYPNCNKPYDVLHHRTAFAFNRTHKNIIPLCKTHHEFVHNGIIRYELQNPENWHLNINSQKTLFDHFYLKNFKR